MTGILGILLLGSVVWADTLNADPSNYKTVASQLQPGDTLELAGGDYANGLTLRLHGTADNWITIRGPESGTPARFLGDTSVSRNTIEIREGSYLALENLLIDGLDVDGIFAISASGGPCHHVRIENCTIVGHGAHQATVAISTKTPTYGWIIRRNKIVAAGTGMYLGNSTGSSEFVGGLIEYNVFLDSKGYNTEIKHQNGRTSESWMPQTPQTTIIRHNVFIKGELPNESGARPNLLVGAFPPSGAGSQDHYEIYGNVFYHNHRESLFQGEGRLSMHDNIFMDCTEHAVYLTDHNDLLYEAYVYNNTFYDVDTAIHFADPARDGHAVVGNLMFANRGVTGNFSNASGNLLDSIASAVNYVQNPSLTWGEMDFYPIPGRCEGAALDLSPFAGDTDYDRDFNGDDKGGFTFRGAYAGDGTNPGWQLIDDYKGAVASSPPPGGGGGGGGGGGEDVTPPTGTIAVGGGSVTTSLFVELDLGATDASGVSQMRFSNNGTSWSPPEPYSAVRENWDLSAYGGTIDPGMKVVYVQFQDAAGNWSSLLITDSIEYQLAGDPAPSGGGGAGDAWLLALLLGSLLARARRS